MYRAHPTFGVMDVRLDGVQVATLSQASATYTLQKTWTSGSIDAGTHTLTLTYVSGSVVTLDAIIVAGPPPTATVTPTVTNTPLPPGTGTYDDTYSKIGYSSGWSTQTLSGDYNNTEHYTTTVGSSASLVFQLSDVGRVSLVYREIARDSFMEILRSPVKISQVSLS